MKKGLLFLILLFLCIVPNAHAQMSTESAAIKNSYALPYPGILPDNPLYKIKVFRDKLVLWLINDSSKKVNQLLLQTDKGIAMVPMLVEKGEIDLAKKTAFKAEDNFTKLTFVYKKNRTTPDTNTYKKLNTSALKHQEILNSVLKKIPKKDQKEFQQVINFSVTNQEELKKILTGDYQFPHS